MSDEDRSARIRRRWKWSHLEYVFDPCGAGHPGSSFADELGNTCCRRCGRILDLTPCGCDDHDGLARSFCPERFDEGPEFDPVLVEH